MIFVSVGTEKFQFNRLLVCIDKGIENKEINDTVFAQIGCSDYRPKHYQYQDYLSYNDMVKNINLADVVVIHAGIGSTVLCLELKRIPVLFPRLYKEKEHLDEHQLEFVKKIQTINKVIVAYDEEELINAIRNYHSLVDDVRSKRCPEYDTLKLDKYLIKNFNQ